MTGMQPQGAPTWGQPAPNRPPARQSRAGWWLAGGVLAVVVVVGGFLFVRFGNTDKPSPQTSTAVPTAQQVPADACRFIGDAALREYLPDATFASEPAKLETARQRQSVCMAKDPGGTKQIIVELNRYSTPKDARASFDAYCQVFSGAWAAERPSAPPTPTIGQAVCGDAPGAVLLLVLQGENVVDVTFKGWETSRPAALTEQATSLAAHALQRLETLE